MSNKSETKYAAEAFELFRLFERFGRTFYELLLLEIGWLLTLVLAAKLTGKETSPPTLALPLLIGFEPPYISIKEVPLTSVSVVGGMIIFVGWAIYSRLHHYLVAPVSQIFRLMLKILSISIILLSGVLNIPLLIVTWPLELWLHRCAMRKEKDDWIKKMILFDTVTKVFRPILIKLQSSGRIGLELCRAQFQPANFRGRTSSLV